LGGDLASVEDDARDHCLSLGGDLASVEDDAEMNFIVSISYVLRSSEYILCKFSST